MSSGIEQRGARAPTGKLQVRSSPTVGFILFALGGVLLVLATAWEPLRTPFRLSLVAVVLLVGAWRILDRRSRLVISADGVRYADWGPRIVPWLEFSGYRWTTWRHNPYLELVPRRPDELVATFSLLGRFGHFGARLIGMPRFAIAVTPLDVSRAALEETVERYLPRAVPSLGP